MNKNVFKSSAVSIKNPETNTTNLAGGSAYSMEDKHALAQLVCTGTFNSTYYSDEEYQLNTLKTLIDKVDPAFLAKAAIYSRKKGLMKDMPAFLAAVLAKKDVQLLKKIFDTVIDDGRMIRNFVQIVRSGVTGRKSFGTAVKNLINRWLNNVSDEAIFRASVGNDPSLADVIKLVHPHPKDDNRAAMFGYITGKEPTDGSLKFKEELVNKKGGASFIYRYHPGFLPDIVKKFEAFKLDKSNPLPEVDFRMLTSLKLSKEDWINIARKANWHTTRMNLNTFHRHGVFENEEVVDLIAKRLADPEIISKVKVFPYQLLAAYLNTNEVPVKITNALQDAMEVATQNIPEIPGKVYVFPDVSGSMSSPVTGYRAGSTSKIRCNSVAALIASCILRKNPETGIIPFGSETFSINLNPRDSVMTNSKLLSALPGGGTDCSLPLNLLNRLEAKGDVCIFVSDSESWLGRNSGPTGATLEWNKFKSRNPKAKLICIDLTPNITTQVKNDPDVLNIGGWSDSSFTVIADFINGGSNQWTDIIEKISID